MKNTGALIRDFDGQIHLFAKFSLRNSSSSFCSAREGECPSSGELGIVVEIYGMIPCFTRGEVGKGLLQEDICKILVLFWDGTSGQAGLLGLSLLCQPRRGG